jgi:hypothetical protein
LGKFIGKLRGNQWRGVVKKKEIGHLCTPSFIRDAPTVARFVPAKTHGEIAYEPSPHPLGASKSLQRGIHEDVFASPNPAPVEKCRLNEKEFTQMPKLQFLLHHRDWFTFAMGVRREWSEVIHMKKPYKTVATIVITVPIITS